jgi:hypothetical protein
LIEASEAQSEIENLIDQRYKQQRCELLAEQENELTCMIEDHESTYHKFDDKWKDHLQLLKESMRTDMETL